MISVSFMMKLKSYLFQNNSFKGENKWLERRLQQVKEENIKLKTSMDAFEVIHKSFLFIVH